MKKRAYYLICTILITLAFALTACGKNQVVPQSENGKTTDVTSSQDENKTTIEDSDDDDALFKEAVNGNISIEYPASWSVENRQDMIYMSRDNLEQPPFISVEEIGFVGSPETFVTNQMNTFSEKYQNRVAKQPEATTMEIGERKLAGFVTSYSREDGTATITRYEYIDIIDDITYHFVCEYVSDAYGDEHEDETTYFEFNHAIESLKIKSE